MQSPMQCPVKQDGSEDIPATEAIVHLQTNNQISVIKSQSLLQNTPLVNGMPSNIPLNMRYNATTTVELSAVAIPEPNKYTNDDEISNIEEVNASEFNMEMILRKLSSNLEIKIIRIDPSEPLALFDATQPPEASKSGLVENAAIFKTSSSADHSGNEIQNGQTLPDSNPTPSVYSSKELERIHQLANPNQNTQNIQYLPNGIVKLPKDTFLMEKQCMNIIALDRDSRNAVEGTGTRNTAPRHGVSANSTDNIEVSDQYLSLKVPREELAQGSNVDGALRSSTYSKECNTMVPTSSSNEMETNDTPGSNSSELVTFNILYEKLPVDLDPDVPLIKVPIIIDPNPGQMTSNRQLLNQNAYSNPMQPAPQPLPRMATEASSQSPETTEPQKPSEVSDNGELPTSIVVLPSDKALQPKPGMTCREYLEQLFTVESSDEEEEDDATLEEPGMSTDQSHGLTNSQQVDFQQIQPITTTELLNFIPVEASSSVNYLPSTTVRYVSRDGGQTYQLENFKILGIVEPSSSSTVTTNSSSDSWDSSESTDNLSNFVYNNENHQKLQVFYVCDTCGKCNDTEQELRYHSMEHMEEEARMFSCSDCSAVYGNSQDRDQHLALHHGTPLVFCKYCRKSCSQPDHLCAHQGAYEKQSLKSGIFKVSEFKRLLSEE